MPTTSKPHRATAQDPRTYRNPDFSDVSESTTTWDEIGFAEFPIVAASKKRPPVNTIEFHERVGRDPKTGEEQYRDWKMVGSDDYGLPYLPDLDIYVAVLRLAERGDYQDKTLITTAKEICDLSGIMPGGTTYERIRNGLFRFKFSGYAADRVFYHPGSKEPVLGEAWSIVSTFRLLPHHQDKAVRDGLPPSYIDLDVRFLNRLRNGQLKPIDLGIWRQLGNGLEKPIFRFLEKNLYQKERYEIGARKFTSRIGVMAQYNRAQLRRLYQRPFKTLVDLGFLGTMPKFEPSKSPADPEKIVFFPAQKARRTRVQPQNEAAYQKEGNRPAPANFGTPEAREIACRFYEMRHGAEGHRPNKNQIEKAGEIIAACYADLDAARLAVDLAAAKGRENDGYPDHIGGALEGAFALQANALIQGQRAGTQAAEESKARDEKAQQEIAAARNRAKTDFYELPDEERRQLVDQARERIRPYRDRAPDQWTDARIEQMALHAFTEKAIEAWAKRRFSTSND